MLTGRALFTGATPQEIVASLLHDSAPRASTPSIRSAPPELRADRRRGASSETATRRFAVGPGPGDGAARAAHRIGRRRRPATAARARGKSLAVLPFVNAGADPQLELPGRRHHREHHQQPVAARGLRVVPRSLAFRYKGLQADPATVGLALNARTILTGRVVQQGDVLNIQAELVDTAPSRSSGANSSARRCGDLLTVQEEIAWQISEALRLKLTGEQKKKLRKRATVNPDAYQEYLRGRYHWNNFSPDSLRRAREHFERAVALDPTYALAYAGLGDAFGAMAYYGYIAPAEGFPRAAAAAPARTRTRSRRC